MNSFHTIDVDVHSRVELVELVELFELFELFEVEFECNILTVIVLLKSIKVKKKSAYCTLLKRK